MTILHSLLTLPYRLYDSLDEL